MKVTCEGLPDGATDFVERATGCKVVTARAAHGQDAPSRHSAVKLYEFTVEGGTEWMAAWFGDAGKFGRELRALSALRQDNRVPNIVAVDDSHLALLLERLPGVRASSLHEDDGRWPGLMFQAGTWLASLHRQPLWDVDDLPLTDAYRARIDPIVAWLTRSESFEPSQGLRRRLESIPERLVGRARVACHRDFTPDNWLLDGVSLVGVLDFEHARGDLAEADVVRLFNDGWMADRARWDAFRDGYRTAGGPADLTPEWLDELALLEALTTLVWALRHGDASREIKSRAALSVLVGGIADGG